MLAGVEVLGFPLDLAPARRPWFGSWFDGEELRHRAAVRGSGLWLPAVLVTGPQTVVGQLVPRRRAENNHIKDLGYNIV